jgi:mannosyltransferase OCH1-like enzyme
MTVPKIIHYCWFGRKQKPKDVINYIKGWEIKLPGYEIVEWNEGNFDVNCCEYVQEAYKEKKYAFVSDYARLYALYIFGGVYLDTDVEVIKPFCPLLESGNLVFGFEEFNYVATSTMIASKGSPLINAFMLQYHARSFYKSDGQLDQTTNVHVLSDLLLKSGCILDGTPQTLELEYEKINILEQNVFSPFDYANHINKADETTYAIHHFGQSWSDATGLRNKKIKNILISIVGGNNLKKARMIFKKLWKY